VRYYNVKISRLQHYQPVGLKAGISEDLGSFVTGFLPNGSHHPHLNTCGFQVLELSPEEGGEKGRERPLVITRTAAPDTSLADLSRKRIDLHILHSDSIQMDFEGDRESGCAGAAPGDEITGVAFCGQGLDTETEILKSRRDECRDTMFPFELFRISKARVNAGYGYELSKDVYRGVVCVHCSSRSVSGSGFVRAYWDENDRKNATFNANDCRPSPLDAYGLVTYAIFLFIGVVNN